MDVADTIGSRSLCTRAQVGCVIVDENQSVLAAGYNGPPPGMEAEGPCSRWCERSLTGYTGSYDNCPVNHAEINALTRLGSAEGATVYVNRMCCFTCAKALASAKVYQIVLKDTTKVDAHLDKMKIVNFLSDCGILVRYAL